MREDGGVGKGYVWVFGVSASGVCVTQSFNQAELVLPYGMFAVIKGYLFRDTSKEYACYLICGPTSWAKRYAYSVAFSLPEPSEYQSHSLVSVRLRRELLAEVLKECARLGLSLIDIHSHPFASDHVAFSGVDEADEKEKSKWFASHGDGSARQYSGPGTIRNPTLSSAFAPVDRGRSSLAGNRGKVDVGVLGSEP